MTEISEELLQGKTIRIYWYLLEHPISGVREIDRQLKFNSPSTVLYQINKLVEAGLVKKTSYDKYVATEPINQGIFSLYYKIGSHMIPRMVFYLSFLFVAFILYVFFIVLNRTPVTFYLEDIFTLLVLISSIIFFSLEALCIWKMRPV